MHWFLCLFYPNLEKDETVVSFLPNTDNRCGRLVPVEPFTFFNYPDEFVEVATYAWRVMDYKTNLAVWVDDVDTTDEHHLDRLSWL